MILFCSLMVVWLASANVVDIASAEEPILTGAFASFHTNGDNKNDDTLLIITIENGHDEYAKVDNIVGNDFDDHRDVGPFGLNVFGRIPKSALRGATTTLKIQPTQDDKWEFNYFLELQFSDCSRRTYNFFTQHLNEGKGDTLQLPLE
jgi:hypothetical protein